MLIIIGHKMCHPLVFYFKPWELFIYFFQSYIFKYEINKVRIINLVSLFPVYQPSLKTRIALLDTNFQILKYINSFCR